jgi:hypothetical protein
LLDKLLSVRDAAGNIPHRRLERGHITAGGTQAREHGGDNPTGVFPERLQRRKRLNPKNRHVQQGQRNPLFDPREDLLALLNVWIDGSGVIAEVITGISLQ